MNYRKVYMQIISAAKNQQKLGLRPKTKYDRKNFKDSYFEFHHVLPKSIFPNWLKRESNIVPLTFREHFFCHQLLTKIYPNSSMWKALACFQRKSKGQIRILTSRQYEICKIAASRAQKGKSAYNKGFRMSEEQKTKLKNSLRKRNDSKSVCKFCKKEFVYFAVFRHENCCSKNPNAIHKTWYLSEETKRKIGESNKGKKLGQKGKPHTEEFKRAMSNRMKGKSYTKGTRSYTDGVKNIGCFEGQQPSGFYLGLTMKKVMTDEKREHYRRAAILRHQKKKAVLAQIEEVKK